MNKEELQWLKEISTTTGISYSGDQTITTAFANKIINYIEQLEQENNQLKEQRQELRRWLEEETKKGGSSIDLAIRIHTIQEVLNKLNELEGGKNE